MLTSRVASGHDYVDAMGNTELTGKNTSLLDPDYVDV
jgi:hypothetical protein